MVRIATEEVNQTLFEEPPRTVEISWARYCCIRQHWLTRGEEYTYSSSSNNIDKLGKVDQANREDNQECLRMQMWNWLLSILDAGYWLFRFLVVGIGLLGSLNILNRLVVHWRGNLSSSMLFHDLVRHLEISCEGRQKSKQNTPTSKAKRVTAKTTNSKKQRVYPSSGRLFDRQKNREKFCRLDIGYLVDIDWKSLTYPRRWVQEF